MVGRAVNGPDPFAEPGRNGMAPRPQISPARDVDGSGGTSMATLASRAAGPLPLADSPARTDDRDDRHRHLERLVRGRRARVRDLVRRRRRDREPDHRHRRLEGRSGATGAIVSRCWPTSGRNATEVDLAWAIVEEMSLRAAPLLLAGVRGVRRAAGPSLDADRPDLLPSPTTGCSRRGSASTAWPRTSSSSSRRRPSACASWRRRPTAASTSMPPSRSASPRRSPRPRPSSAASAGARPRASRSTTWGRSSR